LLLLNNNKNEINAYSHTSRRETVMAFTQRRRRRRKKEEKRKE
jgi:hypothetical protein